MKITAVRVLGLTSRLETGPDYWEQRFSRPIDVYDEFRNASAPAPHGEQIDGRYFKITGYFVEIETDEGVTGFSGPFREPAAHIVASQLRPILMGRDPRATEQLWDIMFRLFVHGRQGEPMHAISAVDLALWDLKGKWLGQPLWQILGGSTRTRIPIYCSALGFEVLDMGKVRERATMFKEMGIKAQKWFFRFGPTSGREGLHKNVELVRTLRETLGDDYEIMLDCWQSFDYRYTVELARAIEDYRPYWIEESIMPDRVDAYRKLRDKIRIPVAGAEHEYTRWGMLRFLEKQALDIYQPDPIWCGGLSETLKIAALTTAHDVICIPHGGSTYTNAVFSALQSPIMTPYQEFLWKSNEANQSWYQGKLWPEDGTLPLPTWPGIYPELDESRIEAREEI